MRVAIVNDLAMAVEALKRAVAADPELTVAWVARDGAEAVEKCAGDTPDLVLMDLIMPVMDGVKATCAIMRESPCPVLVVTATVDGHADKVFEAMGCGALDAVCTPVLDPGGQVSGTRELLDKIHTLRKLSRRQVRPGQRSAAARASASKVPFLIAVASSTGGPRALSTVLGALPADLSAAILVAQHVDVRFAAGMATWLNDQTELTVATARQGETPRPGTVYLAATNDHLVVEPDLRLAYTTEPKDYPYRPSGDALFSSLAAHWPGPGAGVVLTGMGRDGARGLLELRTKGWETIAQDQTSCVVYGMPKAAAEAKAAGRILPVDEIGPALAAAVAAHATNNKP